MERRGYIVARNDHALFPKQAHDAIEARARAVLDMVEKHQALRLPSVQFSVRSTAIGLQTPSTVISAAFPGEDHPAVRLLLTAHRVPDSVLSRAFGANELFVVVEESPSAIGVSVGAGFSRSSCRIVAQQGRSARLIEDLIIDITLGNHFRTQNPIASLVDQEGLPSLFARKVRFARRAGLLAGPTTAAKSARYVMLSALSAAHDDDINARARDAFEAWQDLARSISPEILPREGDYLHVQGEGGFPFTKLRKFGLQLPMAAVRKLLQTLSPGRYVMAVLRSASVVRKSPALRGQIESIFGPKARISSIKIYPYDSFLASRLRIESLCRSGHIVLVHFLIS